MSTLQQIEANRLNAQKSTGPTSAEGKAAVRFNALKSGIHAQSQVIPGEDPAALTLLTAEYYDRYQPATPEVRALVDALVTAEWLQRRFRTLEAQLWQYSIKGLYNPVKGLDIDAADRSYHRALAALQKIESRARQSGERCEPPDPPAPDPRPVTPDPPDPQLPPNQPPATEIGFVSSTSPAPIDSIVGQPDTYHENPHLTN